MVNMKENTVMTFIIILYNIANSYIMDSAEFSGFVAYLKPQYIIKIRKVDFNGTNICTQFYFQCLVLMA